MKTNDGKCIVINYALISISRCIVIENAQVKLSISSHFLIILEVVLLNEASKIEYIDEFYHIIKINIDYIFNNNIIIYNLRFNNSSLNFTSISIKSSKALT